MALSAYQKAILHAMEIPLYEAIAPVFKESTSEHENVAAEKLTSAQANNVNAPKLATENRVDKDSLAKNIQAISEVLKTSEPTAANSNTRERIDESHHLVKQILTLFDANSLDELGISWMIDDQKSISRRGANLVTMHPEKLRTPELKKQLWLTIQDFFKPDLWS